MQFSECILGVIEGGHSAGALFGGGNASIGRRVLEPNVATRSTKIKGGAANQAANRIPIDESNQFWPNLREKRP